MKKTLLTLLLTLVSMAQLHATIYSGTSLDLTWSLDTSTGVLTFSGTGEMDGYPDDYPNWYNFERYKYVQKVVINEGAEIIGAFAFQDLPHLTSVSIPSTVTSINEGAFCVSGSLTSITCKATTAPILEVDVFTGVSSTGTLTIYQGCDYSSWTGTGKPLAGWTTEEIPLTTIPYTATAKVEPHDTDDFGSATYLRSEWDASTGKGCFYFDGEVTTIGSRSFYNCSALTSITIPEDVTSIGSEAFYNCSALTSITIPEDVTSIGDGAFKCCRSITSITIPEGVTSIGSEAFSDCGSLTSITIPEGVTTIGASAFKFCSDLTSITIPASVTSIGSEAFYNSALTSITIPKGVTSIGASAFYNCSDLTSITIPASVTSIGASAFQYCFALTSITCKATTAPTLGEDAFNYLPSTGTLTIPTGSNYSSWTGTGKPLAGWTTEEIPLTTIPYTATAKVEPNSTNAFGDATYLRSEWNASTGEGCFYFDGEVTEFGASAFYDCNALTAITIPASVTGIDASAFHNCI